MANHPALEERADTIGPVALTPHGHRTTSQRFSMPSSFSKLSQEKEVLAL
jgi:hypothetical protein